MIQIRDGIRIASVAGLLIVTVGFYQVANRQSLLPKASQTILDMKPGTESRLVPTSDQVKVVHSLRLEAPGMVVTCQPGKDAYPGVNVKPIGASWDLSAFGHVEARLVNIGTKPLSVSLRVDNAGGWTDNPWNTETVTLKPGESGTVKTVFGYSYGEKPGYALMPGAVVNALLFIDKSDEVQSFRLESLVAGGSAGETPPVAPEDVRVRPKGGVLLGAVRPADLTVQITSQNAKAEMVGAGLQQTMRAVFPGGQGEQSVSVRPATGRWDLRDYLEVHVQVHNEGQTPVTPRVRLDSNGGVSDWKIGAVLASGKTEEIVIPFAGATPADFSQKATGSHITSDAVSAVVLSCENAPSQQVLQVEAIKAVLPATPQAPAWLGQHPPVAGDWVKTLDDEFDGTTLNQSIWSIYGDNYWDKQTHWSKDDVLVGGGVVKLRYEKKTGFNNDDPTQKQTDYAAGYLHTYDKWTQRYGYFEARMKLPTAPGLWPAFWMMPDRGRAAGPEKWKRQDTANGGMEFDIMEHLTHWGPTRYNIAMHYDGYGKDHKTLGLDKIYVQPDKEGFITCGLLWTPGSVVYYCNGHEVLRWKDPRVSNVPSILMFTLPTGGWDNTPLVDSRLPAEFAIDYVRVWQRKDLASAPDSVKEK